MWSYEGCSPHHPHMYPGAFLPYFCSWPPYYAVDPAYPDMLCRRCHHPPHACRCGREGRQSIPVEMAADTAAPKREAVAGGARKVRLTLEYTGTGVSPAPSIKISLSEPSGTSEWNITSIPEGYQVKEDFTSAAPGAKITLEVVNCTARLRWFEELS